METALSQRELADQMKEQFPQYEWVTAQEAIDANIGTIKRYHARPCSFR